MLALVGRRPENRLVAGGLLRLPHPLMGLEASMNLRYAECPECGAAGWTGRIGCECGRPFTAKDEWPWPYRPKWVTWLLAEPGLLLKGGT